MLLKKNILSDVSGLLRPGARVLPWRRPECITGAGSLQASGGAGGCLGLCPTGSRTEKARAFIDAIFRMNRALGIPERFPCIRPEDLPQMAAWAEAGGQPRIPGAGDFQQGGLYPRGPPGDAVRLGN